MVKLERDPKTGSWASRKVIPVDVRAAYGKANEVKRWPGAMSAAQAKAEWRDWLAKVEARVERLRSMAKAEPVRLSHREALMYAGRWYQQQVQQFGDNPGDPNGWEAALEAMQPDESELQHLVGPYEGPWLPQEFIISEVDQLLADEGLTVDATSRQAIIDEAHDLFRALCQLMIRRASGDYGPDRTAAVLPEYRPSTPTAPPKAEVTLTGLFEGYATDGDVPPAPATVKAWRRHINALVAFLGHDDAARLTFDDVMRWKDHLLAMPMKDGGKRSARTINDTYLSGLRAVLNWGINQRKLKENVAQGVRVQTRKKVRLRSPGLTEAEALTILEGTFSLPDGLSPAYQRAFRWVPWVCAYTGPRVNEITQLRRQDLLQVDGVWAIRITPEAGAVKDKEARIVPLHSHLIEQGFVEMVQALPEGPIFYDPDRARGGSVENPQSKKVGERLANWARKLGVNDPAIQPNHGWRHRFKTVARSARLDPEARNAITGHAPSSEGEKYGEWELPALAAEIEKLPRYKVERSAKPKQMADASREPTP